MGNTSTHPIIPRLNQLSQLKSKISSKCHQLKNPKSHHPNLLQMRVLSVTHKYSSRAQFNSIYKTRDKLSVPNTPSIQWWARHRVTVIEIPVKWEKVKWEKVKGKKQSLVRDNFEIKLGKCAFILIRFQDLGILCGSQLHPFNDPSFFMKGSTCLQLNTFISLLSFSTLSGSFIPVSNVPAIHFSEETCGS